MRKKERAQHIQKILDDLYPEPLKPLEHTNVYTLLIAVLLSAQCTDVRVNAVTPLLFARADNPHTMIKLSVEDIEEMIRSCGLSARKAQSIWELSEQLVRCYEGQVPCSFEALEALPGVGHKTASVVMVQGFGVPAFPVDTHIHRCAKRWGLSNGKNVRQTEKDLKEIFPKESWGKLHLQIIHFARQYCRAVNHNVKQCPVCSFLKTV